jgi:hypothetical protein
LQADGDKTASLKRKEKLHYRTEKKRMMMGKESERRGKGEKGREREWGVLHPLKVLPFHF